MQHETFSIQNGTLLRYRGRDAEVTVPQGVTVIGQGAFRNCRTLTCLHLPEGVTAIESNAMAGCTGLTSVHLPRSLTVIGESAFQDCKKLTQLILPANLTGLGPTAFQSCVSLEAVCIPGGIRELPYGCFGECRKLQQVTLPEGLLKIDDMVFFNCRKLQQIRLPQSLQHLGAGAFFMCVRLREVEIPEGITTLQRSTFSFCDRLSRVQLPDTLTCIGAGAFSLCERLTRIRLPDSLLELQDLAFSKCSRLRQVQMPSGVAVSAGSFCECTALADAEGFLILHNVLYQYLGDAEHPVIPDTVTGINHNAFYNTKHLLSVTMGDGVTWLGNEVFAGCTHLQNVRLSSNLTAIGPKSFQDCHSLKRVEIPHQVTRIENDTFQNCEYLAQVTFPEGLRYIGKNAFYQSGIQTLQLPKSLRNVDAFAFANTPLRSATGLENAEVSATALWGTPLYTTAEEMILSGILLKYSDDHPIYRVPHRVKQIDSHAFDTLLVHANLEQIILHDGITSVGEAAFSGLTVLKQIRLSNTMEALAPHLLSHCPALETLHIPAAIKSIASTALPRNIRRGNTFRTAAMKQITVDPGNTEFTVIDGALYTKDGKTLLYVPPALVGQTYTIAEGVETLGANVFSNSIHLQQVHLPPSVKVIEAEAFSHCANLTDINLEGVQILGDCAFSYCALTQLTLNARELGQNAFQYCRQLTRVTLNNTEIIHSQAFSHCENLRTVTLPEGLTAIRTHAFGDTALTEVSLPKSVRTVGPTAFNTCRRITVYDTLQKSEGDGPPMLDFVGTATVWKNYVLVVRSAETDDILYRLAMYADRDDDDYIHLLLSLWQNGQDPLEQIDAYFPKIEGVLNKNMAALDRLQHPDNLPKNIRTRYIRYLRTHAVELLEYLIRQNDMETFLQSVSHGILTRNNLDDLIRCAAQAKAAEFAAYLLYYKHTHHPNN